MKIKDKFSKRHLIALLIMLVVISFCFGGYSVAKYRTESTADSLVLSGSMSNFVFNVNYPENTADEPHIVFTGQISIIVSNNDGINVSNKEIKYDVYLNDSYIGSSILAANSPIDQTYSISSGLEMYKVYKVEVRATEPYYKSYTMYFRLMHYPDLSYDSYYEIEVVGRKATVRIYTAREVRYPFTIWFAGYVPGADAANSPNCTLNGTNATIHSLDSYRIYEFTFYARGTPYGSVSFRRVTGSFYMPNIITD